MIGMELGGMIRDEMYGPYAWVIDRDWPGGQEVSRAGRVGPARATAELAAKVRDNRLGRTFALYQDGWVRYVGRMLVHPEHVKTVDWDAPLYDFGRPVSGCNGIRYWNETTSEWEEV